MAKSKSSKMGSKQFFTIVVGASTALILMLFVFIAQQPTNTQSSAYSQFSCSRDPDLILTKSVGRDNNVVYYFRLKNNDNHNKELRNNCEDDTYVISTNTPSNWKSYTVTNESGKNESNTITLSEGEPKTFHIIVTPPTNARNGTKDIVVRAVNTRNSNAAASLLLKYTVEGSTSAPATAK